MKDIDHTKAPLFEHLVELRRRLLIGWQADDLFQAPNALSKRADISG